MIDKRRFVLAHSTARAGAVQCVKDAPDGYWVTIEPPKRTLDQSAMFHALCGDVAKQATWMGKKRTPAQWKVLFISGHSIASGGGSEVVGGLEGELVNVRESTAQMSKKRLSSLVEYCVAWAAENDVRLSTPEDS